MKKNPLKLVSLLVLCSLCLGRGAALADNPATVAQNAIQDGAIFQFYPPDEGLPEDTTGGASRDGSNCAVDPNTLEASVTLLAPEAYLGLTAASRPEFLVKVENTQAQQLFLSIQGAPGDYHYQAYYPLPGGEGLVRLHLPDEAPDLEVGHTYRWSVAVVCGQRLRPDDPVLTSYVKRVEISQNTAQLSALDRLRLYGELGIWYDSLALLDQARQATESNDGLAEAWEYLLLAGGLL